MKKNAQKKGARDGPLRLLGGLSAHAFMRDYWQKKPLLVRNAIADFHAPLTKREVLELAARDEAESRLIVHRAAGRNQDEWELHHGPISKRMLSTVAGERWTVLVQDTQHFSHEAHDLLGRFGFIPHARIDDLMVSFAVPGAGVGPHFDSYDVFLLQGMGRRRWRISAQEDRRIRANLPVKILARFKAAQEFVLECGDMLYLPPGIAHDGVAETECLTWSIGFRAPSQQELTVALLDHLRDALTFTGAYADPGLVPTTHPGYLDAAMQKRLTAMLRGFQAATRDPGRLRQFFGRYLTEPKSHVFFDAPELPLTARAFARAAGQRGVRLDLRSRLLYDDQGFFLNGEELVVEPAREPALRRLADDRKLPAAAMDKASACAALYDAYLDGYLELGPEP